MAAVDQQEVLVHSKVDQCCISGTKKKSYQVFKGACLIPGRKNDSVLMCSLHRTDNDKAHLVS